jgi:hypothetical protein
VPFLQGTEGRAFHSLVLSYRTAFAGSSGSIHSRRHMAHLAQRPLVLLASIMVMLQISLFYDTSIQWPIYGPLYVVSCYL